MNIGKVFESGAVYGIDFEAESSKNDYVSHKVFKGVSLKHLVKGNATNNQISCHLVKVEPFCILDTHTHPEQFEIHEVIYGDGDCRIAENKIAYKPGTVGVIPPNTEHKVVAGKDGLFILAKFTPALL